MRRGFIRERIFSAKIDSKRWLVLELNLMGVMTGIYELWDRNLSMLSW
jgi:hypothetical protein